MLETETREHAYFAKTSYTCQEWKVKLGSEFNPEELLVIFNNAKEVNSVEDGTETFEGTTNKVKWFSRLVIEISNIRNPPSSLELDTKDWDGSVR